MTKYFFVFCFWGKPLKRMIGKVSDLNKCRIMSIIILDRNIHRTRLRFVRTSFLVVSLGACPAILSTWIISWEYFSASFLGEFFSLFLGGSGTLGHRTSKALLNRHLEDLLHHFLPKHKRIQLKTKLDFKFIESQPKKVVIVVVVHFVRWSCCCCCCCCYCWSKLSQW